MSIEACIGMKPLRCGGLRIVFIVVKRMDR
jgi:hypothetical protein